MHGDRRDGDATPGGVESRAAERSVCKATKRAEKEAKSFGAKPCRGESRRARAGRAAERAGMPGREGSSRDTKPGLGPSAPSSARWDSEN